MFRVWNVWRWQYKFPNKWLPLWFFFLNLPVFHWIGLCMCADMWWELMTNECGCMKRLKCPVSTLGWILGYCVNKIPQMQWVWTQPGLWQFPWGKHHAQLVCLREQAQKDPTGGESRASRDSVFRSWGAVEVPLRWTTREHRDAEIFGESGKHCDISAETRSHVLRGRKQ